MSIIQAIINSGGKLSAEMLGQLASEYPRAQVCLWWEDNKTTNHEAAPAPAIIASSARKLREALFTSASFEGLFEDWLPEIGL